MCFIALTATADEQTRLEIAARLQLEDAARFVVGFDRPNIRYRIDLKALCAAATAGVFEGGAPAGCGHRVLPVAQETEETASWLATQGFTALPYLPNCRRCAGSAPGALFFVRPS